MHKMMKTINIKPLVIALAAMGAAHMPASHAVHLSSTGTGQVLIFPYYTVRSTSSLGPSNYNTLVAINNNSSQYKAIKVRYLEGKNSREVMDLNLFLSPNDAWTAALIRNDTGTRIVTNDNSCVAPSNLFKPGSTIDTFTNLNYSGSRADGGGESLDRTREGYFEVIEMGVITSPQIQAYVKQATNGIPANCAALDAMDPGSGNSNNVFPGNFLAPPVGGLTGRASLIIPEQGINLTYFPTVLDSWSDVVVYGGVGSGSPKLGSASPPISKVQLQNGDLLESTWANGRDAVSATLMRASISNEFILDTGTASLTDWIVTFPTKREHISVGAGAASAPFSNGFGSSGACDVMSTGNNNIRPYDREARTLLPLQSPPICQLPSCIPNRSSDICWGANVIPFGNRPLMGSTNSTTLTSDVAAFVVGAITRAGDLTSVPQSVQGPNGKYSIDFNANVQKLTPLSTRLNGQAVANRTLTGLPMIGLGVHNYSREGVISNYGGVIPARYIINATN
jgi:hypothetical protein